MSLSYLTRDVPGIGGTVKNRAEDFFVQEIPLYEPSGQGEHVYCEIQKIGMTTFQAIDRVAAALGVSSRNIGYAGLKDARALTRQVFSILGASEDAVMGLKLPGITVQWAARHGNKIRLGHLAGNRFAVKIRDVEPTAVVTLQPGLKILQERGMPNYFGEQRFGHRGDNDLLGAALVRGDDAGVLKLLLGTPNPKIDDSGRIQARAAFDAGDLEAAMKAWPRKCGSERRVLHRLIKTGKPGAAVRMTDERFRRLWVSALQSRLFNQVVSKRLETIDKLMDGDLAYKHDNGACFLVESAGLEQRRCSEFEISPTGPMVGYRMTLAKGAPAEIEQEVFAGAGLTPGDFRRAGELKVKGARRPLRVRPNDLKISAGVDDHGGYITVAFTLPAGSFATVLLAELMKTHQPDEAIEAPVQGDEEVAAGEAPE